MGEARRGDEEATVCEREREREERGGVGAPRARETVHGSNAGSVWRCVCEREKDALSLSRCIIMYDFDHERLTGWDYRLTY